MEKKLIDYEGFEAYSKGVQDKYAEKKDIPTSLSSLKEDSNHRTVQDSEKTKWDNVTNKVDKVAGKQLSSNDYTNEDKKKVEAIPSDPKYTDTVPDLTPYAKKETIPTKVSQLENDKTFKTETEIQQMIEKASSLKKEVVTSLPTTGKDDVIYLVKDKKGKENNNYLEYLWLNGKYELIGSTQVDLSGYMTKDEAQKNEITLRHDFIGLREYVQKQIDNTLNKEKDKAIDGNSGTPITDNNTYTTPQYVNYVVSILATSRIEEYGEYTVKELEKKLNKTDIQEFTQQELEEAFK